MRERILTREEETRLLVACTTPESQGKRSHLRPLLIMALDTGMRRGEIVKLKWSDVDFERRSISVRATTTKTLRPRTIGMTSRLHAELLARWGASEQNADALVFGMADVKKSFAAACKAAGIEGFRLHDARHTAITRMIRAGMPAGEVMKISGHTQMTTFARYVNVDHQTATRAAAALDALELSELESKPERIN